MPDPAARPLALGPWVRRPGGSAARRLGGSAARRLGGPAPRRLAGSPGKRWRFHPGRSGPIRHRSGRADPIRHRFGSRRRIRQPTAAPPPRFRRPTTAAARSVTASRGPRPRTHDHCPKPESNPGRRGRNRVARRFWPGGRAQTGPKPPGRMRARDLTRLRHGQGGACGALPMSAGTADQPWPASVDHRHSRLQPGPLSARSTWARVSGRRPATPPARRRRWRPAR